MKSMRIINRICLKNFNLISKLLVFVLLEVYTEANRYVESCTSFNCPKGGQR